MKGVKSLCKSVFSRKSSGSYYTPNGLFSTNSGNHQQPPSPEIDEDDDGSDKDQDGDQDSADEVPADKDDGSDKDQDGEDSADEVPADKDDGSDKDQDGEDSADEVPADKDDGYVQPFISQHAIMPGAFRATRILLPIYNPNVGYPIVGPTVDDGSEQHGQSSNQGGVCNGCPGCAGCNQCGCSGCKGCRGGYPNCPGCGCRGGNYNG